ncbi:hypothetical protein, conserved [Angomonas deanei]|uniref:Uncharacterized protein n=1 Tax=Angomonas deanei TaxID=59799 RepID=A0A7G2CNI5_9TRYP|nr:hypothetical protein, conserved [Angomonas deanei]
MYDVLLHRLSPKTTTLLEYSLRKSLQVYFFVHAKKLTREEEEMTMYLKHCFDTLRTMAPQPGSVSGLMRHIESTAATLREKLRGNMTDLEKKRRQWRSSSSKKEDDSDEEDDERDPKEVAAEKARLYQEYHRVKLLVKRQNLSLRSLVRIRNDCNTLFSNFNAFPPAYLSTTVHLRDQWFTDRQEAEKVPGVFAGQLMNGVSEMSDDSIANGKWDKRYFFPYRKTVPARSVFERWQPHVPPLNLFAGDFAVPRKGVTATLDTREIAKYFDPSDGSATDTIRGVVFLEEPEEDPESGVVPPPSLFVSPHNGLQVKDETYEMGEELSNSVGVEYPTDETVIRKSWSERGGKPNPKSVPSSILNESLEAFQRGSNVQLLSMTGGGPQSCSMVRLLRSPLWLALREMVANILVGQEPEPTGKGERGSPVGLFVSVVQILSADLVKDHFRTGGTDAAEGEKEEGSFTLPFKAAWTPCGPVVEGARYVKLTTVGQFWKLLRNLPPVVTTTRAEQTHLLVSFHLAQLPSSAVSPSRSQGSLETLGAAKVLYSSLSIKMTTDAALFNMLYTPEYTPPNHPKNLFNFIYCDRVVATVDLVADETGEAHFFMKALMAMKEKIRMPMHHYVWSMTNYIHCLSHYIDHLRLALCETQSTADPSIPPLYFTPVSPSKESRTPAGPLTASVSDLTEVWLQANRMLSIALHLCRNRSSAIATPMALSLHTGQVYGIVAPPSSFEKPQTEPYHDASEDSEEDVKPSESFFGPGSLFDEELSQTADGRSGRGKNTETTSERRRSSNKISVQSGTDSQPTHTNGGVSLPPVKK